MSKTTQIDFCRPAKCEARKKERPAICEARKRPAICEAQSRRKRTMTCIQLRPTNCTPQENERPAISEALRRNGPWPATNYLRNSRERTARNMQAQKMACYMRSPRKNGPLLRSPIYTAKTTRAAYLKRKSGLQSKPKEATNLLRNSRENGLLRAKPKRKQRPAICEARKRPAICEARKKERPAVCEARNTACYMRGW